MSDSDEFPGRSGKGDGQGTADQVLISRRDSVGSSRPGADRSEIDLLSIAREEAHRTVDFQIDTLNDIDDKAARILQLNMVIIGTLISALSIASSRADDGIVSTVLLSSLTNEFTGMGLAFLLLSTAVAAITYTSSSMRTGMSGNDLEQLVDNGYTDRENLEGIVDSYSNWIGYNYATNAKSALLGTLTLLLLVYGIVAFALGVIDAIVAPVTALPAAGTCLVLAVLTYYTGFHNQVQRYWNYRNRQ